MTDKRAVLQQVTRRVSDSNVALKNAKGQVAEGLSKIKKAL
jgi:hypothetical protein